MTAFLLILLINVSAGDRQMITVDMPDHGRCASEATRLVKDEGIFRAFCVNRETAEPVR
jgi:hypothetical protein